jgi:hypothetical protein
MPDKMLDSMPERMPEKMPNRIFEHMPDRMSGKNVKIYATQIFEGQKNVR